MTVTPIADWETLEEVMLPSGKVIKARRPDLVDILAGDGDIPDVLTEIIMETINGGEKKELILNKETLPQLLRSLNVITKACFVEPKIWDGDHVDAATG